MEEIHDTGNGKGFFLFEETVLVFETQDLNIDQDTKVATAGVIFDKKERATPQSSLNHFFKRVDRIESSNEPEPVPSTPSMREIAACPPPSPVADNPSALPPSTFPPSSCR